MGGRQEGHGVRRQLGRAVPRTDRDRASVRPGRPHYPDIVTRHRPARLVAGGPARRTALVAAGPRPPPRTRADRSRFPALRGARPGDRRPCPPPPCTSWWPQTAASVGCEGRRRPLWVLSTSWLSGPATSPPSP